MIGLRIDPILCGYARQLLKRMPDQSVDLIFTSPLYANQRKKQYASISTLIAG